MLGVPIGRKRPYLLIVYRIAMFNKLLMLLVAVVSLTWAQDPAHFDATCVVRAIRNSVETEPVTWRPACHVDDMAAVGYNNRFHIMLYGDAPKDFFLPRIADMIRAEAGGGRLIITSLLWGRVEVYPLSEELRKHFTAGGYEVRPQHITVTLVAPGITEVLIDEPWGEFTGKVILPAWWLAYQDTLRLLSHAH